MLNTAKEARPRASGKSSLDQEGPGYRLFSALNIVIMCLVILITLYPVYYVVAASVSEADLPDAPRRTAAVPIGQAERIFIRARVPQPYGTGRICKYVFRTYRGTML